MSKCSWFIRLQRDESGQTLVLAAVMLPVLIASVGMAIDVGYAFDYRQRMQMAADSGALAGAYALDASASITSSDLAATVAIDTAQNGFTNGTGGVTVTVCRPGVDLTCPTTYTYTSPDKAVKVTISQPRPTFFSRVLGFTSWNVGVSAVAASGTSSGGASPSNFVILSPNQKGAFTDSGGSSVTVDGKIEINSSAGDALKTGGAIIANGGVFINGGYDISGGGSIGPSLPTTGAPVIPDPLASLPVPTPHGTTYTGADAIVTGGVTKTVQPGIYPDGLKIDGKSNVTMAPGEYFFPNKDFIISDATVTGDGIFMYTAGAANLSVAKNTTTVTMTAPTSGTYKGILYFQERTSTERFQVQGGATSNFTGVIYAKSAEVLINGGSNTGSQADYTVIVSDTFTIGGGGYFNSDFSTIGCSPLGCSAGTVRVSLTE